MFSSWTPSAMMKSSFTGYCTTTYSLFHLGYIYLTMCLGTPTINFPSPPLLIKALQNQKNGWAFQTDFSRISDFVHLPLNSWQFFMTFTYTHKKKTIYHMQLVMEISQITSKIIWKSLEKKNAACDAWEGIHGELTMGFFLYLSYPFYH